MKKYLAFDIETANTDEIASDGDLLALRPLGISCATAIAQDIEKPFVWHGKTASGKPSAKMTKDEAGILVKDLMDLANDYTIVTWNGVGFDFDILAEESGLYDECRQLASGHIDMLFHVVCALGCRVGLQKAAEGMEIPGKSDGMCGMEAPKQWAAGKHQKVIDYCVQDVKVTLNLAIECSKLRKLQWLTKQGVKRNLPLPSGWLTVTAALQLPEPDTSWMTSPSNRYKIAAWMNNDTP